MASRYGRKKRRKHLEQIAQLELANRINLHANAAATAKQRQAEEMLAAYMERVRGWEQHLRDMLDDDTVLTFEPRKTKEAYAGMIQQVAIWPELRYPIGEGDFATEVSEMTGRVERVLRFVGGISPTQINEMRRYVHMEIVCGDDPYSRYEKGPDGKPRLKLYDWNYAISEATLQRGLTDHQIIHIAEQIALKFHERLKAELGRK